MINPLELQRLPWQKIKLIHLLFWHAVRRERCGDTDLFDAILNLEKRGFNALWSPKTLTYASPRAVVLAGPCIDWGQGRSADLQDLISRWIIGISVAPRTEEVARCVAGTLLQIAAYPHLRPFIPADAWLWLNERPSLPPVREDRRLGSGRDIIRMVRELGDMGVLTSHLIMIWSEWKPLDDDEFAEMRMSVCEDFNGVGSGYHRAELIQRMDCILGEVDRQSGHHETVLGVQRLWGSNEEVYSRVMKDQYVTLKRMLQEVDREATEILYRTPPNFIVFGLLTLVDL